MALRERLIGNNGGPGAPSDGSGQQSFQEMKARLHRTLINRMDLTKLSSLTQEQVHAEVSRLAENVLAQEAMPLSVSERERLVNDVQHELFGLGPLEPLLKDPTISDILVNSHDTIYIERRGKIEATTVRFKDDEHLMRVIERIVSSVGRRIDESSPMVDARLQDGSRVNAVIRPVSIDGPCITIRKFKKDRLRLEQLVKYKSITPEVKSALRVVDDRLCIGGLAYGENYKVRLRTGFPGRDGVKLDEDKDVEVALGARPARLAVHAEATRLRLACVYAFRPRWRAVAQDLLDGLLS